MSWQTTITSSYNFYLVAIYYLLPILNISRSLNYSSNAIVNMRRIWIRPFIVVGFNLRSDYFGFALSLEVIAVCQLKGYFQWYDCLFNLKSNNVFESSSFFYFLFLARIRFPKNESISSIVQKRYSGEVLKAIRKFEKVDYKLRKAKLDISFLVKCQNENIIFILSFIWLIKTFKILLPTKNANEVSYKQKLITRNHIWELCKMNSIVYITNCNLNLIVPILLIFLLSFLVVMIIF